LNLNFTEKLESVFDFKLYSKTLSGETLQIDRFALIDLEDGKHIILNFDEIYSQELKVMLKISEAESWKFAVAYEEYSELSTK
ncbi:MAG: hypothetical protein ACRDAS_10030, partial [Cetobacterium sp.]